ncbi:enoyl-CoA hydratase [Comamonas serinivorans]|uniref:Enoyl-CoA hydratase n=1 Tax=Comamonas serinivorans TaxID=1082851 RepID=A0A1Y0EQR2_9BURK|nr:enoyl-CoA hydratase/isomerase family protein [Comamonas serinivorans]ARU05741.1 enoyl-CoA hydratase [Comamonas serinivorans]
MPLVTREDRNGLTILTLNRPDKLNALNVALFTELRDHVLQIAEQTERVGVVVLRGAGKCFSAGHDLADIAVGEKPPKPSFQADTIEALANLPQPVISAVHGHCYTGALELALAGDLILAADNAKFADTHAKWSLTPVWGMSQRLPRRVGLAKASEMMFTARTYTAQEAVAMNLANFCVPLADFDAEIDKLGQQILANSWFSHRANKALLKETDGLPLAAGLSYEIHRSKGRGPDMQERIAAFSNKTAKVS